MMMMMMMMMVVVVVVPVPTGSSISREKKLINTVKLESKRQAGKEREKKVSKNKEIFPMKHAIKIPAANSNRRRPAPARNTPPTHTRS
jgi:hypothetical protein